MIDVGDNPVEAIYTLKDRIYSIHFKDFTYDAEGNRDEAIYGEGKLDSIGVMKALKDIRFKSYASIEYEGGMNILFTAFENAYRMKNSRK